MKLLLRLLPIVIALYCFANFANANERNDTYKNSETKGISHKLYLEPSQIQITNDGIFFEYQGQMHCTDTLFSDQGGLYTMDQNWRCPLCQRPLDIRSRCMNAGCKNYNKQV